MSINYDRFPSKIGNKLKLLEAVKNLTGSTNIENLYFEANYILKTEFNLTESKELKLLVCLPSKGITIVELNDKQKEMINLFSKSSRNMIIMPRQSGKSTGIVFHIANTVSQNPNKKIMIISENYNMIRMLSLQLNFITDDITNTKNRPGFIKKNESYVEFDNHSSIIFKTADIENIPDDIDELYFDEFDFISNSKLKKMKINPKTKINMVSTRNENNHDSMLVEAALGNVYNISFLN